MSDLDHGCICSPQYGAYDNRNPACKIHGRELEQVEQLRNEIAALKADQLDWRKGVALIASALGEKDPPDLSCVRIADIALNLSAERDALKAQNHELNCSLEDVNKALDEVLLIKQKALMDVIALKAQLADLEHKVAETAGKCGVPHDNDFDAAETLDRVVEFYAEAEKRGTRFDGLRAAWDDAVQHKCDSDSCDCKNEIGSLIYRRMERAALEGNRKL